MNSIAVCCVIKKQFYGDVSGNRRGKVSTKLSGLFRLSGIHRGHRGQRGPDS